MNTVQITRALRHDPFTSKKFCGVFPSDKLPQAIEKYPVLSQTQIQAANLEYIGCPFTFQRKRKENFLTVMDIRQNSTGIHLEIF